MLAHLAVVGALAVGFAPQCDGGGSTRPDCYDANVAYTANGYGVREIDCVRGPGTMVATWECVRSGAVVSKPMARKAWSTTATFAASCWNATVRITSITP